MTEDYYNNMLSLYDKKIEACRKNMSILSKSIKELEDRIIEDDKKVSGNWFTRLFK